MAVKVDSEEQMGVLEVRAEKLNTAPGEWTSSAGGKGPGTSAKTRSGWLGAIIQRIFLGTYKKVWENGKAQESPVKVKVASTL